MPNVDVVGALILREGQVLLAQRGSGALKGKWEFPGGKVKLGDTRQIALAREINEELEVTISVGEFIDSVCFQIGCERLALHCHWAYIKDGEPNADEHPEIAWVDLDRLLEYDLAPADVPIAREAMNSDR